MSVLKWCHLQSIMNNVPPVNCNRWDRWFKNLISQLLLKDKLTVIHHEQTYYWGCFRATLRAKIHQMLKINQPPLCFFLFSNVTILNQIIPQPSTLGSDDFTPICKSSHVWGWTKHTAARIWKRKELQNELGALTGSGTQKRKSLTMKG